MTPKKTYIDSGVLFAAFRGEEPLSLRAYRFLDSSDHQFVSSLFVRLEVLPKAIYHQQQEEVEFHETFFAAVSDWAMDIESVTKNAYQLACTYGLAAVDALHIASALLLKADEFITTEKPTKPMFRVTEIPVISILLLSAN
ncbi:MAG: type II toxin-antitoxin system VapC family toxin [Chloroflexaceae bacterium]|nr:type II toxin-antitoxin system VapC family toxin [Chloroflexaceae bacterium]